MNNRLLILTQVVDKNDSALGFFHGWALEFAKHSSPLTIVCLKAGVHSFSDNVKVLSLGKESKSSRLKYIYNFYKYIWRERKNYDAVFVHMNQEYVLLGGLFWKIWGKRVGMWRNHSKGSFLTNIAVYLSNVVFCTSPKSYTARFGKTKIMPAGIDTTQYASKGDSLKNSILFFGRLSPVKNVHVFVEALQVLDKENIDFHADIIGSPANPEDGEYEKKLKDMSKKLIDSGKVSFFQGVPYEETASLYSKYSLYVNLTPDGSLDKTMLEAMASSTPVLLSNSAFRGFIPEKCQLAALDLNIICEKIKALISLDQNEKMAMGKILKGYVEETHSLDRLIQMIENHLFSVK